MTANYVLVAVAGALIAHAGAARAGNNTETGSRPLAGAPLAAGTALDPDAPTALTTPGDDGAFGLSTADIRYFAGQAWSRSAPPYVADMSTQRTSPDTTPPDLPPSEAPLPEPVSFAVLAVGLAGLYSLRRPKKN